MNIEQIRKKLEQAEEILPAITQLAQIIDQVNTMEKRIPELQEAVDNLSLQLSDKTDVLLDLNSKIEDQSKRVKKARIDNSKEIGQLQSTYTELKKKAQEEFDIIKSKLDEQVANTRKDAEQDISVIMKLRESEEERLKTVQNQIKALRSGLAL
jgi:chromosome segregation ATPase